MSREKCKKINGFWQRIRTLADQKINGEQTVFWLPFMAGKWYSKNTEMKEKKTGGVSIARMIFDIRFGPKEPEK